MRCEAIGALFALAGCSFALDTGEPDPQVANAESFVPVASVEQNIIEVNGTRYKLDNITSTDWWTPEGLQYKIKGITREWPNRASLLHPNFWTYWIHATAQILAVIMAQYCPVALLVVLVVAVFCWPISMIMGTPLGVIWAMQPGDSTWWLMAAKSAIVNIGPTVPMMYCLIWRPKSDKTIQYCAIWTYCILWANVAWTLCFLPMAFNAVSATNGVCGVVLCISLIIHNVAICRKSDGENSLLLFELTNHNDTKRRGYGSFKRGDVIFGYGTSLSWLVCYTVWNALFVLELAVGLTFQDIAFWAMMIYFYYMSKEASGVENYFAMARPISLSMYIATSDWPGLLDYFRGAEPLGIEATSHAYFFFLAVGNVFFSFYVLYWEICLCAGCNGADEYFRKTFKNQKIEQLLLAEEDEETDDEESAS